MKKSLPQRISDWTNERWPLAKFMAWGLHEEIPGGTRFSYTLGSTCMFLLILQIITGLWQMFYYVPTVDYAYSSLNYLRFEVPFGWLIHGMHYWGAHAFTVVVGMHAIRVFIWGAYKKPRELVWLAGVALIILTALFMFTGPVLPWDKMGYWAAQVGLNMAGSAPFVGSFMQGLIQGASKLGQLSLTRIYVIHVALLPFATFLFVIIHLVAFRVYGSIGPWRKEKKETVGEFWPEQLFKDALVWWFVFMLLVYLSAFIPAPVAGLADPMDTLFTPKPEWNFLFLYECLKYFSGPLEPIGTVGIPLLIIMLLLSLPFLDRSPERHPAKRGFVLLCGFVFCSFVAYMTYEGSFGNPPMDEQAKMRLKKEQDTEALVKQRGIELEKQGIRPDGLSPSPEGEKDISGEKLFQILGCIQCHSVDGKPNNKVGPDLSLLLNKNVSRDWLRAQLISPDKHNTSTVMPLFGHLSDKRLNALIDYLQSLVANKEVDSPEDLLRSGEKLFHSMGCMQCHTAQGSVSHKQGPDLIMALSAEPNLNKDWLRGQILNPQKHNMASVMPSYLQMDDHQIAALTAFLMDLAKRKPAGQPPAKNPDQANAPANQAAAPAAPAVPAALPQEQPQPQEAEAQEPSLGLGQAVHIVGSREHGMILFQQYCMRCHGPEGTVNPSDVGKLKGVPSVRPIRKELFDADMIAFVRKIDPNIQHGHKNTSGGPDMPAFGDTHELTQAQIADIEAYILHLNGVERDKVINPGVEPTRFFYYLLGISIFTGVLLFVLSRVR